MIRAVVFDCFGVLYEDAYKEFVERYAQPSQYEHFYDLAAGSDRGLVSDHDFYTELSALSGETPGAIQRRLNDTSVLNRGVVDIIEELRFRYQIGLLSNSSRPFLEHFLAAHNIRRLFDVVVASSETGFVKPQREIFEQTASRLGIKLSEMVFVDDSSRHTTAAEGYGVKSILYQNPAQLRQALAMLQSSP